ncbi:MAG: cryptochrome/photolyase family protein [Bacteroidetes bacterium]|nr:MAG: cryptochrome/photolyase family protein [Bacteroidota bacterium]
MKAVNLVFPHQLFEQSPFLQNGLPVYLVEEHLFFRQYAFHRQKIAFHRASMQFYADWLHSRGISVQYIASIDARADIRTLVPALQSSGVQTIHYIDLADDWLEQRLRTTANQSGVQVAEYPSPQFLNRKADLRDFFRPDRSSFFQTAFYIEQRKKRRILLNGNKGPLGGKWSFDAENRKKYPSNRTPPPVAYPENSSRYQEARSYVQLHYANNPGILTGQPLYPTDFTAARSWLHDFLRNRFAGFGPYEDAIVREEPILHHSVLTPLLNSGLLTPQEVVDTALGYAAEYEVPLNSTEGFIRQIIGWREFIRGIYIARGRRMRTRNFWGFNRPVPAAFYNATTGIPPVDITIKKVLRTGYCHHIERLMVLGNFMLLCEFDPDAVYQWFMELFIDAYDWVMVPNVYGMSQFADGGTLATKPYISGSNYLLKMSDYPKGGWQDIWDALFWRFLHVHRDFFRQNPRLGMLVSLWDKMPVEKQARLLKTAEQYLQGIGDAGH